MSGDEKARLFVTVVAGIVVGIILGMLVLGFLGAL